MRAIGLALVALALSASPASAAVLEIRENPCGCDGSSGDEDTRTLIVRAAPGEDAGAPLSGIPAATELRFAVHCRLR